MRKKSNTNQDQELLTLPEHQSSSQFFIVLFDL